jgi:ParB family chromosome partitioning protein
MVNISKKSIKEISTNNYNPNKIDDQKFKSLIENIKRFGYVQPILVDSNNVIIDGEHRFKACIEAGFNEIECVVWESDETTEEYKKLLNYPKLSTLLKRKKRQLKDIRYNKAGEEQV